MRTDPLARLHAVIVECVQKVAPHVPAEEIKLTRCRDPKHGDLTTNAALIACRKEST